MPALARRTSTRLAALALSCTFPIIHETLAADLLPFTVADSIALTRIVNPDPSQGTHNFASVFRFSPDGGRFLVVVRKGNITTGMNEYALVMFDAADVLGFVNSPDRVELPRQTVLARFAIAPEHDDSHRHAIDQVQWTQDSQSVAFIGRGADGIGQVYLVELENLRLTQLTSHPEDIATFGLALSHRKLIYSAYTAPDWTERNTRGYAVIPPHHPLFLGKRDPRDFADWNVVHFIRDVARGSTTGIEMDPGYDVLHSFRKEISVSASGRWAVVPHPVRRYPAAWSDYEFLRNSRAVQTDDSTGMLGQGNTSAPRFIEFQEAFGAPDPKWTQYQLIDLTTGSAKPLLDAPTLRLAWDPRMKAHWSPDGTRVLLPPTFLPLDSADRTKRERRSRMQAVAEVELATGRVTRVFDAASQQASDGMPLTLTDVGWTPEGDVIAQYLKEEQKDDDELTAVLARHRRLGGRWTQVSSWIASHPAPGGSYRGRLSLRVSQDMNTPFQIAARDLHGGRERLITDLNPQLREFALGRVELFTWTDRLGRRLTGGLVLPPRFKAGVRYPVVFQTSKFDSGLFLLDSSSELAGPEAARALANHDIIVLQMQLRTDPNPNGGGRFEDSGETPLVLAQIESAIDALDNRGLIDPNRVGLIGFSRNGMYVQYAVTFSIYPFAAATIADSVSLTPYCYAMTFGRPYPGMTQYETEELEKYSTSNAMPGRPLALGAPFWGEGIQRWLERSYIYHLDRIRTPIRYEEYGTSMVPCNWEPFAILNRHRRPVEMFHIPLGSHALRAPFAVYASKQGNVDWFAFWLKEEEDPDPAKADQYMRWRKLRAQHTQHLRQIQTEPRKVAHKKRAGD